VKYIYPVFVLIASILFFVIAGNLYQANSTINYFGLGAYGSITLIMMLALFIVQKVIEIKDVYYYLLAGFTFIYISLFMSAMDKIYAYPTSVTDVLEDLFRIVGFGFIIVAIIKWIKYDEQVKKKLIELASIDDLTGVTNRRVFDIEFKRDFANAKRYKEELSLVVLDLDHFKDINDRHGHFFGDLVLKLFTKEVSSLIREGDLFSRWGGDEFCLLLPQTAGRDALIAAEKIRFAVKNMQVKTDNEPISFTVSMGISSLRADDKDAMLMMERADKALYEAKRLGRDRSILR